MGIKKNKQSSLLFLSPSENSKVFGSVRLCLGKVLEKLRLLLAIGLIHKKNLISYYFNDNKTLLKNINININRARKHIHKSFLAQILHTWLKIARL